MIMQTVPLQFLTSPVWTSVSAGAPHRVVGSAAAIGVPALVTAAAKLTSEVGKATLWISIVAASFAVFMLLRGASRRGRDWFYAAAAGACLVTLLDLAFVNVGLSGAAIALLSATIFRSGRSNREAGLRLKELPKPWSKL
ncbi:MAG: hypothetical protein ACREC9_06680 [Methylocella sp.]